MEDTEHYEPFLQWLEPELNSAAAWCTGYVAAHGEAPPEKISYKVAVLRACWDAWQVLVVHDHRYQIRNAEPYTQDVNGFEQYLTNELEPYYNKVMPGSWNLVKRKLPVKR